MKLEIDLEESIALGAAICLVLNEFVNSDRDKKILEEINERLVNEVCNEPGALQAVLKELLC